MAASSNNLAVLHQAQGQYTQAEPLHKRSLAIWRKALGLEQPNVATSLDNLAETYRAHGRYAEAEPLYERPWPFGRWCSDPSTRMWQRPRTT